MKIKELKSKSKKTIKKHYLLLIFLCLLSAFFNSEFSNSLTLIKGQNLTNIVGSFRGKKNKVIEEKNKIVKDIKSNPAFSKKKGIFATAINTFSSNNVSALFKDLVISIINSKNILILLLVILSFMFLFIIYYYIKGILSVIIRRSFLEARLYDQIPAHRIAYLFHSKYSFNIVFTMFIKRLYQFLWDFTIIGGVIKHYSYRLVPYILAENPSMKANEVIKLSQNMMQGYKWRLFKIDLSFILWDLLDLFTFGLVGIFYANPYKLCVESEFFVKVRSDALIKKVELSYNLSDTYLYSLADKELLNETYSDILIKEEVIKKEDIALNGFKGFILKYFGITLYSEEFSAKYNDLAALKMKIEGDKNILEQKSYPIRLSPIKEKERKMKIDKINYLKGYTVISIIALFLIFSMIGWTWEVMLHLIKRGNFVNRGVLFGPWLPIYGSGGILILTILNKYRNKPKLEFLYAVLLCGIVEYFTSVYLELTHDGMRWWNYSGYFLNLNGRICLENLLVFGLGGIAVVYAIAPYIDNVLKKFDKKILTSVVWIILSIFIVDQIHSSFVPNTGRGISSNPTRITNVKK